MRKCKHNISNKIRLREYIFLILWWVFSLRIIIFLRYLSLHEESKSFFEDKAMVLLRDNMYFATIAGLIIGVLVGLIELYLFPRWFRNKSLRRVLFVKTLVFVATMFFVSIMALFFYVIIFHDEVPLSEYPQQIAEYIHSSLFYYFFLWGLIITISGNFLRLLSRKFGHAQFFAMLTGRYYRPREEERVFLFMDLDNSTLTNAKLGHVRYSKMIQECYKMLAGFVEKHDGEIYQFVGDEVVITWRIRRKRKEAYKDAVRLFFDFSASLSADYGQFWSKYGIEPSFTGAVGQGYVTVAEVGGEVKTEIAYHGQVLNLTSRMMEEAKHLGFPLMTTLKLTEKHPLEKFDVHPQGNIKLRGIPGSQALAALSPKKMISLKQNGA